MSQNTITPSASVAALPGDVNMAARIAAFDWAATPLGPMDRWPQSLRVAVGICLQSKIPMFVWWGRELINLYNDAYAPLLGLRHPAALGQPAKQTWSDIWSTIDDDVRGVMERGIAATRERVRFIMLRHGYPEEAFYTYSYSPILDEAGGVGGMFQVCIEETARVLAEQERDRSANQRQLALDAAQMGWWHYDPATQIATYDDRYAEIFQVTDRSKPNEEILKRLHPDDLKQIAPKVAAALDPNNPQTFATEYRIVLPDGAIRWIEAHGVASFDGEGASRRATSFVGTVADITERRNAAEQSRTILESVTDAFFAVDSNWRFTYLNSQAQRLLDQKLEDVLGVSLWKLYPGLMDSEFGILYQAAVRERVSQSFTSYWPSHKRWYEVHAYPAADGSLSVYFRDATARQFTERQIRASEARFRELADAMPQIVWTARADGTLDYYNRRWYEFIGLSPTVEPDAVLWSKYVHPDDLSRVGSTWAESISTGKQYQVEFRVRNAAGRYCWMLVRAERVLDDAGKIKQWYGTCTDIEAQKQAEARNEFLLSLDAAARTLTDPSQITAVHARMLGEHLGVNRCAYADVEGDEDTFNLTGDFTDGVASAVGRYRFSLFGAEVLRQMRGDLPYVVADIDHHAPPPEDFGAFRAMEIRAVICVPLHKGGKFTAAMAVHQTTPRNWTDDDVDLVRRTAARCWESIERARVQRDLRESETRFRMMADTAPVLIWMSEKPNQRTWFNKAWLDFTGRSLQQEVGVGWAQNLHADDRERCLATFYAAYQRREAYSMDYRLRRSDGEFRWIISHGVPLQDAAGGFKGFIGSAIDITERKLAEETHEGLLAAERNARTESDRASRMKDEFLATLSHELRTPLNAILGWSQILGRDRNLSDSLSEGIDVIERNARAQAQIIEDLLDMSRIISGKLRLDVQRVDLASIVQASVDTARPTAEAKGVRLGAVVDPLHGVVVNGDVNRLQQILWNLISNSIKFTPRGGRVQVLLERVNSHLEISVADTGEGIAAEFLPHVFDRFRQADASTTRRHGGLGLGLSIVKQLVELHGGDVRVKSAGPGQGTTFIVALPLTVLHPEPEQERRHPRALSELTGMPEMELDLSNVCVLVVDDEADARALVKRLLEERNAKVATAGSVADAIKLLKSEHFDLLVSDIGMPGEDGYALIRQVRGLGPTHGGNVPAIALTAYARAEDRVRAVAAGFLMHVAKPVEAIELLTMAAAAIGRTGK